MKELSFEQMEEANGGGILRAIGCTGTAWGAVEFGATIVAAAAGPVGWVAIGTLILAPTFIGLGAAECITGYGE